jgi:hypothetical protein
VNVKLIPPTSEAPLPADWKQQVGQTVAAYGDQKALFGYMLKDEPNANQFGQIRDVVAEFARRDSSDCTCVNRDCKGSVSVELRFSQEVRSVRQISEKNGRATPVPLENRRATMVLEAGGGVLLRLDSQDAFE